MTTHGHVVTATYAYGGRGLPKWGLLMGRLFAHRARGLLYVCRRL